MIASALGKNPPGITDKNDKGTRAAGKEEGKAAYPAGKRLRPNELDAARKNDPCSKSSGKPLCWDYNSRAGCHSTECKRIHGKMKQSGVHWGVLMQLARRGGLSGLPIILPEKIDGYVQAIRDKNTSGDTTPLPGEEPHRFFANGGPDLPCDAVQIALGEDVMEVGTDLISSAGSSANESIFEPTQRETVLTPRTTE